MHLSLFETVSWRYAAHFEDAFLECNENIEVALLSNSVISSYYFH